MLVSGAGYAIDSKERRSRLTREDGIRWESGRNSRDELTSGKKRENASGDPLMTSGPAIYQIRGSAGWAKGYRGECLDLPARRECNP